MTRRPFRWLAALALVTTAVACGGDDDDASSDATSSASSAPAAADATTEASTGGGAGTTAPSSATGSTAAAVDDAELDPDGTLRIATFAGLFWDPVTSPSGYTITWLGLVYDRLVHNAPDGSLVPGLATSWEYADDGSSVTFHLREDVTFQDGTPFDAAAVKTNIDRAITLEGSTVASELGRVAEVVVVDPLTVRLDLSSADATLPAVLSGRAGAMVAPAALADPELDQHPIGTGMFKLAEFTPDSSFAVERWDGYWDPDAVKVQRIEVTILPDSAARINALTTGTIDIAPIEPADVTAVEDRTDDVAVRLNDTLRYVYLAMNLADTPLDDLRVRQAISYALDREGLLNGPYLGYGTPTEQPWPEGYFPHVADLDGTYPYDPDKARELLAEAGYPDGFAAEIIVVPAPRVYTELGEAVQAQLAEVGIDLTVRITEASQLGQAFYTDKLSSFALLYTNGSIDPAITVGSRWTAAGFFNPGKYSTPTLEDLYVQSIATTDDAEREGVLQDVSREVVGQVLDMPIFFAQEPEGINDRVVGYESWVTGRPEFRGVGVRAG